MQQLLTKVKSGMNFLLSRIAALLLIAMSFLVIYQVFTRYVLNNPSDFTEEIVRYLLIWTGFIGAAYAFSTRQHMALLIVSSKLNGKARRTLAVAIDMLVLVFAISVLIIGGAKLAYSARMEYSALLGISRSLVYSMAPISGCFIVVAQLINIWEDAAGIEIKDREEI
jgi:TRAP-type transport system small permease protein